MRARLALALSALLLVALAVPAAAQSGDATVYVAHGVPDTDVDVYVNGELTLDDFTYTTITDGLSLPAGTYQLDVRAADAAADAAPLFSASADVPAGANVTVVAHLDEGGAPVLTPFVNDVSTVPAGQARLTVRHTAAAPAVDILAGGQAVVSGLTSGNDESLEVPTGTIPAAVALAGTTDPVIGPADVSLGEGTLTIVHAVGSGDAGYELLSQTIGGLHSSPGSVESGTGGLATTTLLPYWALAAVALAGLLAVGSGARLAVLRARR